MNGEIEQLSNLVISARKALYEDGIIEYVQYDHDSIKFVFISKFFKTLTAESVEEWFDICKKRGLTDIMLYLPSTSVYRPALGFTNYSRGVIICFWKSGKESFFVPKWEFDALKKGWNISYTEHKSTKMFGKRRSLSCRTDEFKHVLLEIEKLAYDLDFPQFSQIFHGAYDALCDKDTIKTHRIPSYVPDEFRGIYYAVDSAHVFGAMGSWNDSPSYYAHEMGLEQKYNKLSDMLLQQIYYHLMYVSNECWK